MQTDNKWIPIEDLEITPEINSIHVDTRDFHCFVSEEKGKNRIKGQKFPIPVSEIKDWLLGLEKMTGGKGKWRLMDFRRIDSGGWFKYIRLYRNDENSFNVCNRDGNQVMWQLMTEDNLNKEGLCFCKED